MKIHIFEISDLEKAQILTKKGQKKCEIFFQIPLKNFLYLVYQPSRYLKGPFNLVVYASKKIMFIRHVHQNISKKVAQSPKARLGGGQPLHCNFNSIWRDQ